MVSSPGQPRRLYSTTRSLISHEGTLYPDCPLLSKDARNQRALQRDAPLDMIPPTDTPLSLNAAVFYQDNPESSGKVLTERRAVWDSFNDYPSLNPRARCGKRSDRVARPSHGRAQGAWIYRSNVKEELICAVSYQLTD